jgi:hypothetical protein
VFGKNNNTNVIELSDIAAGIGGFVINGELEHGCLRRLALVR